MLISSRFVGGGELSGRDMVGIVMLRRDEWWLGGAK